MRRGVLLGVYATSGALLVMGLIAASGGIGGAQTARGQAAQKPAPKPAPKPKPVADAACVNCHKVTTPGIVEDYMLSKHRQVMVGCSTCHGSEHNGPSNVDKAKTPTPDTCANCHENRVEEFKQGKHAMAWTSMKAMPTIHFQPMLLTQGMKGCGGCHKIGLKTEAEIKELKEQGQTHGNASCDACHTRHTFSVREARQPQACQTCHMGFDHAQWEMYSSSKHGVRHALKQNGTLPESASAPTCQTCHMQNGNHAVGTAWGFLAVRLPMPEDEEWAADRTTILKGLGVLDPEGKPTARLEAVKAAKIARLTQEDWQSKRDEMLKACVQCHSSRFAQAELKKGDDMIRQADKLMAEGIRIVADLYKDGIIAKPESSQHAYPDILAFHDATTEVEQVLFRMFMEHRMRAFQGTFHQNPDYALWYGWSEMRQDLTRIKELGATMRAMKVRK